MDVHLITIEVSIVRAAVSIVHPNSLLFLQDLGQVSHHGGLVKRGLSVDKKDVTVAKMPVNDLLSDLELVSDSISLLLRHILEKNLVTSVFILDHVSSRVHGRAVPHQVSQPLHVDVGDAFGEGQLAGHEDWHSDLVSGDIGVR